MKKIPIQSCQQNLFEMEAEKPSPNRQHQTRNKSDDSFVLDMVDALQAPVLTFSMSWADTIPQKLLSILPMARMLALMKGEQLATYAEVAIYIYTRALEGPMDSDLVSIYTHVTCTVFLQHYKEDHFEEIHAPRQLSDWLQSKLMSLRKHIYEKRREILKKKLKSEGVYENKRPAQEKEDTTDQPQQSLFS